MSDAKGQPPLDSLAGVKQLIDQWCQSLAQVLESMTDRRPDVRWQAASGPRTELAAEDAETLWWEQPFHISPEVVAWVAAPRAAWEYAGTVTLKAAGLETVEAGEARNTWLEILGQSLSAMARSIGSVLGHEVNCEPGVERIPDADLQQWASVTFQFADATPAPLLVGFSPKLVAAISGSPPAEKPQSPSERRSEAAVAPVLAPTPRSMDMLLEVDLPVSISFGKTQLPLKDVLKLTTGSIVELSRGVNDQVEVLVSNCLIARGEVVVVEGNYGVRIQEIVSRQDRLRSIR